MRRRWHERRGSVGGLVGVMVAVAGGFGAAVGLYALPDPQYASVAAEAYASATQRAVAASTIRSDEFGSTVLRIEAVRGVDARAHADITTETDPNVQGPGRAGVWFEAIVRTCTQQPDVQCDTEDEWRGSDLDLESLEISPLLDAASFSGEVQGCTFEVTWHPEGLIGPFEGHDQDTNSRISPPPDQHVDADARAFAYAEVSRVAPADIQMSGASCFAYSRSGAPGYVSQGVGANSAFADLSIR